MNKFSLFAILILFIFFLAFGLITLNSDFIAISIFVFFIFLFDLFNNLFFYQSIIIEAERKVVLVEDIDEIIDNQKQPEQLQRFVNNQILKIETSITVKSRLPFFFKVKQVVPSKLKIVNDNQVENETESILINNFYFDFPKGKRRKEYHNKVFSYSYNIKAKRGEYEFEPLQLYIFSPLFLSAKQMEIESQISFYVAPDEPVDIDLPIRSRKLLIYAGLIPSKKAGNGLNFFDVRKYYEGDKLNLINWKHSARNNELYVNDFERETNTDVSIIMDCRNSGVYNTDSNIFEKGLDVAYSIAKSMIKSQNRVGYFQFGSFFDYLRPGYGKVQLEKITRVLSSAKINEQQDFWELDNIPVSIIPSQSLVFLITPLSEDDIPHIIRFHRKKYRFIIIALDYIEYSYRNSDEKYQIENRQSYLLASSLRKMLIETARKTGAVVLNYDCMKPFNRFIKENYYYLKELTRKYGRI